MNTLTPHLNLRDTRRRALLLAVAIVLAGLGVGLLARPVGADAAAASSRSYGYPVKPFDRRHPIRGTFGDPGTIFFDPPTVGGVLHSAGKFSFHTGVDISAPDGTVVYPVASGKVTIVRTDGVRIDSGSGRMFEYWHIKPSVRLGDKVELDRTALGTILRGCEHVHLTELAGGRPVNPLQPGHLTPYADTTKPSVASISFRTTETGDTVMTNFVRGRLVIVAEAYDTPSLPVPGIWHGMPVTPALVTWRIQRWTGKVVVPERATVDFRVNEPPAAAFWNVYERGTFQNMSVFGKHYSYLQPGNFLFKLTPAPIDTRQLHDGVYEVVVTATDTCGNSSFLVRRFTVHNRPGWIGS